jgi:hypothetical protein
MYSKWWRSLAELPRGAFLAKPAMHELCEWSGSFELALSLLVACISKNALSKCRVNCNWAAFSFIVRLFGFGVVREVEILYIRAPFEQKAGRKTSANRTKKEYNPFICDVQPRL